MNYTNARKELTVNDWPYGSKRTTAIFSIETGRGKERAVRITVNPKTGRENKPKKTTFSQKTRIVDGSDGKTYIAKLGAYGAITIMQSNLQYQQEYISDNDSRFTELLELFN